MAVSKKVTSKKSSPVKGKGAAVAKKTSGARQKAPGGATPGKMPAKAKLEAMKKEDQGFALASTDAVKFIKSRQQGIYNIARQYHLDPDELFQEGYEVLLTCLRDFSPLYQKKDGSIVTVQFTTFFGSRMDIQALEMRNRNPEYRARQAYIDDMDDEEKARFRANPPLLVQHIDHESNVQDHLDMEIAEARDENDGNMAMRVERDSFFEEKLAELIANETDDRKKAALLQVKVGGVYNFQEMAYHFGVTDSRASQVLNDLVDAFYTQRLIDKNIESVAYDFQKLKFNEKRAKRLIVEAWQNAPADRQKALVAVFSKNFPQLEKDIAQATPKIEKKAAEPSQTAPQAIDFKKPAAPAYEEIFSAEENKEFPLLGVEVWPVDKLSELEDLTFRPEGGAAYDTQYINNFDPSADAHPLLINDMGQVIDGVLRLKAAKAHGVESLTCVVRKTADERAAKILRVSVNIKLHKPNKTEIYFAVAALADLGLSQSKIAGHVGTSRTNVLVYAKVREKAAPKLRALFEDGLIQITNAATCADLPEKTQAELAGFIRKYGETWAKGTKFNDLYTAALKDKIAALAEGQQPAPATAKAAPAAPVVAESVVTGALNSRIESYEQALADAETWAAQREQVISNQTELLDEAHNEIELLKKELEAAELSKYASPDMMENHLRALRIFYEVTERLSGAGNALKRATTGVKALNLKRKQILELEQLMDSLDQEINSFRITLLGKKPS